MFGALLRLHLFISTTATHYGVMGNGAQGTGIGVKLPRKDISHTPKSCLSSDSEILKPPFPPTAQLASTRLDSACLSLRLDCLVPGTDLI